MSKVRAVSAGGVLILVLAVLTVVCWSNRLPILAALLGIALLGVVWALVDNLFVYRRPVPFADPEIAGPVPGGGVGLATAEEDAHPTSTAS